MIKQKRPSAKVNLYGEMYLNSLSDLTNEALEIFFLPVVEGLFSPMRKFKIKTKMMNQPYSARR